MSFRVVFFTVLAFLGGSLSAQNINVSGTTLFEGEPYLVIDPEDSHHMVIAWMGYSFPDTFLSIKTKVTYDAGVTWGSLNKLPHFGTGWNSADPSLAFDHLGNLFACYVDFRESPDSGGVYIAKSIDGGSSWQSPVLALDAYDDPAELPIDRPWLVIDTSSGAYQGNMYITTFSANWLPVPNRPYFIRSTDGGASWASLRYLDTLGYYVGPTIQKPAASPIVDASGNFRAIYPTYDTSQHLLPGFLIASSIDGGTTLSHKSGFYTLTPASSTLGKLAAKLTADPSDPNHIAILYTDAKHGDIDLFVSESVDGGDNWTIPIRVNDDPLGNNVMQDLAWGSYDESGNLAVAWRDRRNGTGTGYQVDSEIWGAILRKDSSSFSSNFPISDTLATYNHTYLSLSGNDFLAIEMVDDTISTVWGDVRNGKLNIWFQRMSVDGSITSRDIIAEEASPVLIYPNPVQSTLMVESKSLEHVQVYTLGGILLMDVSCQTDKVEIDLDAFQQQVLLVSVVSKYGKWTKKVVRHFDH